MSEVSDYVDVRDLHPDYKTATCYRCGETRRFKRQKWGDGHQWVCQECNRRHRLAIEIPCVACDAPLRQLNRGTTCAVCGHENQIDREGLRDEICDQSAYPPHVDKPGVLMGDCPICGEDGTINGDPDGALFCDGGPPISEYLTGPGCFYAGQYSDEWYAYALWRFLSDRVVVHA